MKTTLFIIAAMATLHPVAADVSWHLSPAEFRVELTRDSDYKPQGWQQTELPSVSVARICASGIDVTQYRPVVVGADKRVACRTLWSHNEEPLEIIFDSSGDDKTYYLYLIAKHFRLKDLPWEPKTGMILETRHPANSATIADAPQFVSIWTDAAPAGRSFIPNVHQAFPIHRPSGPSPRSYDANSSAMSLHRYVGYFHISETGAGLLSKMRNQASKAGERLRDVRTNYGKQKAALREAEAAVLPLQKAAETSAARAESATGSERDKAIARKDARIAAQELAEGKQHVADAEHEVEVTQKRAIPQAERKASFTEAAIAEIGNNTYTFYAGSNGPSFVLLDGAPLVSWTEATPPAQKGDKYRDFKATSINLQTGLHRIEYLYASPGDYLAMLAWRPPGERQSAIMPADIFATHGRYIAAAVSGKESTGPMFDWRVTTDLRVANGPDLVDMHFAVTNPQPTWRYEFDFGDGTRATGTRVDHLYLGTGSYPVTLTAHIPSAPKQQTAHTVHAHILWENRQQIDLDPYSARVSDTNYSKTPIDLLINGFDFVRRASAKQQRLAAWRSTVREALVSRIDSLPPEHATWAKHLGDDCAAWRVRRYSDALTCYAKAIALLPVDHEARPAALLGSANMLIRHLGQPQPGIDALVAAEAAGIPSHLQRHAELLRADAMLGLGEPPTAVIAFLQKLTSDRPLGEQTRADLKLRGVLRHARSLAESQDDPVQLQHAMDKLDWITQEAPLQAISPELNQVLMEIQLARQEYAPVWVRSGYLLKLNLSELVRPKILALQVRALAGMGSRKEAFKVLALLTSQYPYSPAVTDAKRALR
jgi:hypothetical protein